MKKIYRISSAAAEVGVSSGTIKNWEKRGLINCRRDVNGHRIFTPSDIEQIRRVFLPMDSK